MFIYGPHADLILYKTKRTNSIYLFYEQVKFNANGLPGQSGDNHYKCHHGNGKVLTVTKKMRYSLNGWCHEYSNLLYFCLTIF